MTVTGIISFTANPISIRFSCSGSVYKEQNGESENHREEMLIMNERFVLKKIKDYLAWRGGEKKLSI